MVHSLKNKRVLITAGPTWVAIDKVRVISNIATGETGILLAQSLERLGAKVTLLLGPVSSCCLNKRIKLIRFKFFDELKKKVIKELASGKYDVIIHNAAVSDFKPLQFKGKISSEKAFDLKLKPLPKVITYIRRFAPRATLVMFKLESGISSAALIKKTKQARAKIGADLAVANMLNPYRAFIIDGQGACIAAKNKSGLVAKLTKLLVTCLSGRQASY